ncbi:Na+/solute symporter [Desulforamulus reducens MI-1]|uniref:Na+/solute symporter n=1 Tax=Desulforamulus reducens (strain ATCC BAA-1160 / DSM 100696 / MI-1) TaxID=349161 RepID=A4J464_DESRM|nr:sodium:solute symporter family protein [Desulforamulus reducens]ABO49867.1 Na+/solute symporter [Desulforamulus reducens MI-1]
MLSLQYYLSFFITLAITTAVGVYSLRFVRTASDFNVGGRQLPWLLVTGSLVGSFIGGTSTVGTAQVAYQYGISGIYFTLGAGLGCLVMGLFLAKPMRQAEVDTIPQFLGKHYGRGVIHWSSTYTTIGIFIQVVAQILSAAPLLMAMLPISFMEAAGLSAGLIVVYILFGGFWGASLVGLFKTLLICGSLGVAGIMSYQMSGGFMGLTQQLPIFAWLTPFPAGVGKELASIFSVVIGFISTQTYMQAIFAGKDVPSSRKGVLLAGLFIPAIGAASVAIGVFMRINYPDMNGSLALPLFIIHHLPQWFGGVVLAALLISLVTTGASLTLGACTMFSQDIYRRMRPLADDKEILSISRIFILLFSGGALLVAASNVNSMILQWAFLSMALRGVTVFFPLLAAIFYRNSINRTAGFIAISMAPLVAITWPLWQPFSMEPLYIGMLLSLACLLVGGLMKGKRNKLLKDKTV